MADSGSRLAWTWERSLSPELRVARALEYAAHYLDRIEDHLERLANTTDANGAGFVMIQKELAQLRETILQKK